MDEMKITSKFLTRPISKLLERTLAKKLGYNISIQLNAISVSFDEGKARAHLDLDCETEKEEFSKMLNWAN